MKKISLFSLALFCSSAAWSAQNQAEVPVAYCGTGDALGGVDVYVNQLTGESKIVLLSMADPPEGQDATYTFDLNAEEGALLKAGKEVQIVARSEDSFAFGGALTHAVLLNLKINTENFSYEHNSKLAEGGTVYSLFCNKTGLVPPDRR